jgi:hypothetical protein
MIKWMSGASFLSLNGALATVLCLAGAAPADSCSGGTGGVGGTGGTGTTVSCVNAPGVDPVAPGLEKTGVSGVFKVRLVSASPSKPIKGVNSWTIRVFDASSGAAVTGSVAPHVVMTPGGPIYDPYMEAHGHPSSVNAVITANGDGSYTATPLYYFMPGVWRMGFDINVAGRSDTVFFYSCIEG